MFRWITQRLGWLLLGVGDFTDDDENADGIPDYLDPIANPAKLYYFPIISHIP